MEWRYHCHPNEVFVLPVAVVCGRTLAVCGRDSLLADLRQAVLCQAVHSVYLHCPNRDHFVEAPIRSIRRSDRHPLYRLRVRAAGAASDRERCACQVHASQRK